MIRGRIPTLAMVALAAVMGTHACGDGGTEPPPPDPPRPTTVTITPSAAELAALEATVQLAAEVRDQYGNVMANASVSWSSSDDAVAAVDGSGLVTAAANGAVTITATSGQASGTAAVTVAQVVAVVTVTPEADTLVAIADTVRLAAEGRDANGHVVAGAEFDWSSSDDAVVAVDGSGLVTAAANGAATITATSGQASGTAAVTVAQVVAAVAVTPEADTLVAIQDTVRLAAEGHDANGHVVAGAEFEWSSSDDAVAAVDRSGLVTAAANGAATITATSGQASGTAALTVAQVVAAVTVTPLADTLVEADTLRFSAEAADANGHAVVAAEFAWSSGDTLVAIIDDSGLATGIAPGVAQVTATSSGLSGSAALIVAAAVPTAVSVTPEAVAFTAIGQTEQLSAEVRDQIGRVMDDAAVSWSSGDTAVAVVDAAGVVKAGRLGTVTITATAGDAFGTATVTVTQVAGSVVVSPAAATISIGDTLALLAEAFDANGNLVDGASFEWSSSDGVVATVGGGGMVRGAGEGTATITAAAGDARGTSAITVENPDRGLLAAFYEATDGPNWVNSENWLTDAPLGEWYGVSTDESGRVVGLRLLGRWDDAARRWVGHGLAGPIPLELVGLTELKDLSLGANQLTGPIPPELGSLARLEILDLWNNELTGPIPAEIGNLANLRYLVLGTNRLSGTIPPELGDLANLVYLRVSGNRLTGPIPPELDRLAKLEHLDLQSNDLTGSIPPELGGLANLRRLRLGLNRLTGSIPPELGGLTNLERLSLWLNELTGSIPAELGGLANLRQLELRFNELTGSVPPELGGLANLTDLHLSGNRLSGPIPRRFLQLDQLRVFLIAGNESLCVPGVSAFVEWLQRIEFRDEESISCNADDVATLRSLFEATGGADWTNSAGWLGDGVVGEWHGVSSDSLGHVTQLDLSHNGLAGRLPGGLGDLGRMTVLRIAGNALSGRLPLSLSRIPLQELSYEDTDLCVPPDTSFQAWLNGIPSHEGTGVECAPLSDREILEILYHATDGPNWTGNDNWLTGAQLANWENVRVDRDGRVVELWLGQNNLTGSMPPEIGSLTRLELLSAWGNKLSGIIPPELGKLSRVTYIELGTNAFEGPIPPTLGNLTNLEHLSLWRNDLSGPIPPELGQLTDLEFLRIGSNALEGPIPTEIGNLSRLRSLLLLDNALTGPIPRELGRLASLETLLLGINALTGSIPPELGNLASARVLWLGENQLSGPIPPELGNLSSVVYLALDSNNLTGPLPPELGRLSTLDELVLSSNQLTGPVPPGFSGMSKLRVLALSHNAGLSGPLPIELTALGRLDALLASGTDLCVPGDPDLEDWLNGVYKRRIAACNEGEPSAAYLVQAVQSREFPVPLVTGERALLRVFPTAGLATDAGIPAVRARFYRGGREIHTEEIPGKSTPIPTEVDEGSLSNSANAEIPEWVIQPGLEMVIEVDPEGTLDDSLGVARRIPETGRLEVDVREMPPFDLTLIPFVWTETRDAAIVDLTRAMAADPYGHEMFADMNLLPIGEMMVTAHQPVLSSSNSAFTLLSQTVAIRAMEGGAGHYMGMMSPPVTGAGGVARLPGRSSFSQPFAPTIAHELGHNLSLYHAPCGGAGGPDSSFPYTDGSVGAWGYDFREEELVRPETRDLMSYCWPKGISDYHFTNALNFRLSDADSVGLPRTAAPATSLLLWGGIDADSVPFLEPAFVVDAPPTLPGATGDHRLTGHSDTGTELFALSFAMPVVADGDGSSSFAFVLPAEASWETGLATITLTGPGGSVTLDGDSDLSMAILRDPRTGQVRGILSDLPASIEAAVDAVEGVAGQGLEVLFSRGIPGAEAWRR